MRKEDQSHVVPAIFVNLIAACSYFAMATGQLDVRVNHAFVIELPRYFDWQVTTPLLVLSLAMVALPSVQHFARARERTALIGGLIGAQAMLILTGIFAALNSSPNVKWFWYGISCVFQLAVWWLQWGPIRTRSREHGGEAHRVYTRMLAYLTGLWLLYPVVWALGPTGAKVFGQTPDAGIFMVLDVLAKVAFNVLLLGSLLAMSRRVQDVRGHDTIELISGSAPEEEALDAEATGGRVHLQPAISGGVRITAARNGGNGGADGA
jgi:bacteriorhodopsin